MAKIDFSELRGRHECGRDRREASSLVVLHHALINGAVGLVATRDGRPFSVGGNTVRDDKIVEMDCSSTASVWRSST